MAVLSIPSIFGLKGERMEGVWVLTDGFFSSLFCYLRFVLLLILVLVLPCPASAAIDFFFAFRLLDCFGGVWERASGVGC